MVLLHACRRCVFGRLTTDRSEIQAKIKWKIKSTDGHLELPLIP